MEPKGCCVNTEQAADTQERLIELARAGDREAFGRLVSLHYDGVIQVVYRMCSDVQIAEDAAQEAFIRAWQKLSSFQEQASFRNWIYRIALNAAYDLLRRKAAADLDDEETGMLEDSTPGPEASLLTKEQAERVKAAIQALPEASRAVIVLREYGGLSYQEISEVLEIPIGTVMSRLNYARDTLRKTLERFPSEREMNYV
jgi:RNA polymerase sigma-70 factor, ECF subfamily